LTKAATQAMNVWTRYFVNIQTTDMYVVVTQIDIGIAQHLNVVRTNLVFTK